MNKLSPLAQTFYVQDEDGIFITSVDIYFFLKDENIPISLQIRPMELGLPSQKIYPFGEVILEPDEVSISSDGLTPTRFVFPSPIYLEGDKFHSIVLLTNSDRYKVWISQLGIPDQNNIFPNKSSMAGGLFTSQNGTTWTEEKEKDLKFSLFRADFISERGDVSFYSPNLSIGNAQISVLLKDSIEMQSKKLAIGIGTTLQDMDIEIGNTIIQLNPEASANFVDVAGIASGNLQIINAGIGYTPSGSGESFTFNNVPLSNVSSDGLNATANITISEGVAVAATISTGGLGYKEGDILTALSVGTDSLGRNLRLSVSSISGINELILDNVQGSFTTGVGNTLFYINTSGITTEINHAFGGNVIIPSNQLFVIDDGLHIKVNHKNHGMYSSVNRLIISDVESDVGSVKLVANYDKNSTNNIALGSTANFNTFENLPVGSANPGYIRINDEIIAYTGIQGNSLTGITREIDETKAFSYSIGQEVFKYELNGISLRRINREHSFEDVTVDNPFDLDFYNIRLDMSQAGKTQALPLGQTNRTGSGALSALYPNTKKSTGGNRIKATQNIQFNSIRPIVQNLTVNNTNIISSIRTISGKSINGTEIAFQDNGFNSISLLENNFFDSPRLIASKVNENNLLGNLEGNKSLTLRLDLESANSKVSPVIDLDRVGLILSSNRVNSPITDYVSDPRSANLRDDPNEFVYATKPIQLEIPSNSIRVIFAAYVNVFSDIRSFYSVLANPKDEEIFYPFPGFNNLNNLNQVIDISRSDGTSDRKVPKTDILSYGNEPNLFRDYEFTINNLETFRFFSIKIIGTSTNQSYPPRIKDLRVLALAT